MSGEDQQTSSSLRQSAVLHALRLAGVSDAVAVAERAGMSEADVLAVLTDLAEHGYARQWAGTHAGWQATEPGRVEGQKLLASEVDSHGCRPALTDAYNAFLPLNGQFLALCADWQTKTLNGERRLNDHLDDRYDRHVVKRLAQMHARIAPVLAELTKCLTRFSTYEDRLSKALAHVESGLQDWFTRPGMDSYHSVWFELHEDLLATLGLNRVDEQRRVRP